MQGFPRLYAAASLKREPSGPEGHPPVAFSAALCRGLIEARTGAWLDPAGLPFSAALCRGLIEAASLGMPNLRQDSRFSAALCRGLIEA